MCVMEMYLKSYKRYVPTITVGCPSLTQCVCRLEVCCLPQHFHHLLIRRSSVYCRPRDSAFYCFTAILQIRPVHVKVLSVVNYRSFLLFLQEYLQSTCQVVHNAFFPFYVLHTSHTKFHFCKMSINMDSP